jgi:hypothetical protein
LREGYALLTHVVAQQCDLEPGEFIWTGGDDCHIYANHFEQVDLQLSREPLSLPRLVIKRRPPTLFDLRLRGFRNPRLSESSRNQGACRRLEITTARFQRGFRCMKSF